MMHCTCTNDVKIGKSLSNKLCLFASLCTGVETGVDKIEETLQSLVNLTSSIRRPSKRLVSALTSDDVNLTLSIC